MRKKSLLAATALVGIGAFLLLSGVVLPLGFLDDSVESAIGAALGRTVELGRPLRLRASLRPELIVRDLTIGNPDGWPGGGALARVERARAQLGLLELLRGELEIDHVVFEGAELRLVSLEDGVTNFAFSGGGGGGGSRGRELTAVSRLGVRDLRLQYEDRKRDRRYRLVIDEAEGRAPRTRPLRLTARGRIEETPWKLDGTGGPIRDLVGGSDWTLETSELTVGDSRLEASGTLDRSDEAFAARLTLDAAGGDLGEILALAGVSTAAHESYSLHSRVAWAPGELTADDLRLEAFGHSVEGSLAVAWRGDRPSLEGSLSAPELDLPELARVIGGDPTSRVSTTDEADAAGAEQTVDNLIGYRPPWEMLESLDAHVSVSIGRTSIGTTSLLDTRAQGSLDGGSLTVELSTALDAIPVSGRVAVNGAEEVPEGELAMAIDASSLPALLGALGMDESLAPYELGGRLGPLELEVRTRGETIRDLLGASAVDVRVGGAEVESRGHRLLRADSVSLRRERGAPYRLSALGSLLDRPLSLSAVVGRSAPGDDTLLSLDLEACDTRLTADLTAEAEETGAALGLRFDARGRGLCGVLASVESFWGAEPAFAVRGDAGLARTGWWLRIPEAELGGMNLDGRASLDMSPGSAGVIEAELHSREVDLNRYLQGADAQGAGVEGTEPAGSGVAPDARRVGEMLAELLEREVLPRRPLLSEDADVTLRVDRVTLGRGEIDDLEVHGEIRDGALVRAPSRMTAAGRTFSGDAALDLTGELAALHLELATENLHLPALFEAFELEGAPNLAAEALSISLDMEGRSLGRLLRESRSEVRVTRGRWTVGEEPGPTVVVDVDRATWASSPASTAVLDLRGHLNTLPFFLSMTEDGLFRRRSGQPFAVRLESGLGETRLFAEGTITRAADPGDRALLLTTRISGRSLDELSGLIRVDLPPLGPYEAEGSLKLSQGVLTLGDLLLRVGDSTLEGQIDLTVPHDGSARSGPVLRVDARMRAETVQLDDLRMAGWSPVGGESSGSLAESTGTGTPGADPEDTGSLAGLIGPEVIGRLEGSLSIDVGEVLSGRDVLGGGRLRARLEDGAYALDELRLDIPGGAVSIDGTLRPIGEGARATLGLRVDHLDYGVLIRRAQPDSDLAGDFSLSVALEAEADRMTDLGRGINGRIRFAVVPENYEAGAIDLWAVNILSAALPILMKGSQSVVNCLAGDFVATHGVLTPDVFLLDTGRVRVEGTGEVDLPASTIDFRMRPTPKRPQFLSAATPIRVTGSIFEPTYRVTTAGVLGTILRMTSGLLTTPFKRVFTKNMDPDGTAACEAAMAWATQAWEE